MGERGQAYTTLCPRSATARFLPVLRFNSKLPPVGKRGVKRQREREGGRGRQKEAGWAVGWEQPALVGNACHSSICAHTAGIFHPPGKGN